MILYKKFGLNAREAAEVTADVVEIISKRLEDDRAVEYLKGRYSGSKLHFAILMIGRLTGMSLALQDFEKARMIVADFSRLIKILEERGRDELIRTLEREILEETYAEEEFKRGYV
ncbi:MAG: hypothetical protein DRP01_04575 [Archaeoglobales archaeon]|nr:MAG: hypothetical protein DRP01_04575 [Archaeoglobales archaeon]